MTEQTIARGPAGPAPDAPASESPFDPTPLLRSSVEQFLPVEQVEEVLTSLHPERQTPITRGAGRADFESQASARLLDAVRGYEAQHGVELTLLRYTATKDGTVAQVIDAGAAAPAETDVVHFTVSGSVADAQHLSVVGEELVTSRPAAR